MQIFIEKENKQVQFPFKGTGSELLAKLKINRETVIIVRNDELVTDDIELKTTDEIKLLSVISGG